jgi:hypothetical protein
LTAEKTFANIFVAQSVSPNVCSLEETIWFGNMEKLFKKASLVGIKSYKS